MLLMRLNMDFLVHTASLPMLWHCFGLPHLFKDLLIWKEPSKDQLHRPGWYHQEKLGHWDSMCLCESPASSCSVIMRWLLTQCKGLCKVLHIHWSLRDDDLSPWATYYLCVLNNLKSKLGKRKIITLEVSKSISVKANKFEQSLKHGSQKNISIKKWKKIQYRDYPREDWIHCI